MLRRTLLKALAAAPFGALGLIPKREEPWIVSTVIPLKDLGEKNKMEAAAWPHIPSLVFARLYWNKPGSDTPWTATEGRWDEAAGTWVFDGEPVPADYSGWGRFPTSPFIAACRPGTPLVPVLWQADEKKV